MKTSGNKGFFGALFMIIILSLSGCNAPDINSGILNEVYKYPKELWGEWIRMDTGDAWYIESNYLKGLSSPDSIILARQSENVIEVTDSGKKYYLYASRTANSSFTGRIAGFDETSLSMSRAVAGGRGWINIVVEDLDNGDRTTTQTDADGNFEVEDAIPGDDYQITPEGGTGAVVTPIGDGDDIGTITVVPSGVNFKATIKAADPNTTDMNRLYADGTAGDSFEIIIENTGTEDCTATYNLDFAPELIDESAAFPMLGTIEPGKTKKIEIRVRCQAIQNEYEYKKIGINITDPFSGNKWQDSVSLKFNKAPVDFTISANGAISGIIITPTANAYPFKTSTTTPITVTVPWSPKDYLVVFSGATADTEAMYSLGVGVMPYTDFSSFSEPDLIEIMISYETNNTEGTAAPLKDQAKIMSFLRKNDIDYYRVNLSD